MELIHLNDALKKIDDARYPGSSQTFKILFLKCDRKRRTGGQWVTFERAQGCGLPYINGKEMKGVVDLASGLKYAVHNHLIFELNGAKIYK